MISVAFRSAVWHHFCLILCVKTIQSLLQGLTAYYDIALDKCYITELNTTMVMPPRNLWELLINVKVSHPPTWLSRLAKPLSGRADYEEQPVPSTRTVRVTHTFVCLLDREGLTFLRPTSSRRTWWWQGGWRTWGSWVPLSTGCASAKKPSASDVASSTVSRQFANPMLLR